MICDEALRVFCDPAIAGRGQSLRGAALLSFCLEKGIEVLVIDNLSSMSSISENDNDDWKQIGDWLLDFRRNNIAVVVVHHAGKNGAMRGASRREDAAFWIVSHTDSKERTATTEGARFVSTFTKNRNDRHWPEPVDWHISESTGGAFEIKTTAAGTDELVFQAIAEGVERCSEIAEMLGYARVTVSKAAKRLETGERIKIDGGGNQARYRVA
ncbi:MAG: hypothetical protein CMO55_11020 [Verrucomicrobiales bacterium]|nr:hypothetical protein [Verrucomicrobiales bacterium]